MHEFAAGCARDRLAGFVASQSTQASWGSTSAFSGCSVCDAPVSPAAEAGVVQVCGQIAHRLAWEKSRNSLRIESL
jgi:hypothetical protein